MSNPIITLQGIIVIPKTIKGADKYEVSLIDEDNKRYTSYMSIDRFKKNTYDQLLSLFRKSISKRYVVNGELQFAAIEQLRLPLGRTRRPSSRNASESSDASSSSSSSIKNTNNVRGEMAQFGYQVDGQFVPFNFDQVQAANDAERARLQEQLAAVDNFRSAYRQLPAGSKPSGIYAKKLLSYAHKIADFKNNYKDKYNSKAEAKQAYMKKVQELRREYTARWIAGDEVIINTIKAHQFKAKSDYGQCLADRADEINATTYLARRKLRESMCADKRGSRKPMFDEAGQPIVPKAKQRLDNAVDIINKSKYKDEIMNVLNSLSSLNK